MLLVSEQTVSNMLCLVSSSRRKMRLTLGESGLPFFLCFLLLRHSSLIFFAYFSTSITKRYLALLLILELERKIRKLQFKYEEVESNDECLMFTKIQGLVNTFQDSVTDVIVFLEDVNIMTATLG